MKQSSKLYNPHPVIEALKSNEITEVLSEGFAMIYQNQPEFPISYLSQFLLNYVQNKKETEQLEGYRNRIREIEEGAMREKEVVEGERQEVEREGLKVRNRNSEFRREIEKQKEPRRFSNKFCTWIQQNLELGAVYIGELKHPTKVIQENDMAQMAHLDTQQPKRIEYISSSENQQHIIVGKSMSASSLTGSLFEKKEEEKVDGDGEGQEGESGEKENENYIYVPNVIKDNRVTYLRFPRLGAYLSAPLFIRSYLNQNSFEVGFQNTIKHNKDKEELEKELERKESEFRELYEEKARNDADEKELEEMEQNFEREKEALVLEEVEIPHEELQFVVCADTLGLEKQIQPSTRKQLLEYISLLKSSWEKREHQRIKQDIDNQAAYQQLFQGTLPDTIQKLIQNQEKDPQDMSQFQRFKANEKEYQFQIDSAKLQKLKQLLSDQKYQTYFSTLTAMNVLRFQPLMQMVLYFLGHTKKEINFPGTNILDWNRVRVGVCNQGLIERLVEYSHRGAKPEKVEGYSKWSRIVEVLEKMDYQAVLGYNLFYGCLLKYMLMTARLRRVDSEIRREKLVVLRAAREERIKENERLDEEKERVREEQRAALEGNEENPFDEEAWEAQYNEEHPQVEIEPDYEDEVDNDLEEKEGEEGEQQQP